MIFTTGQKLIEMSIIVNNSNNLQNDAKQLAISKLNAMYSTLSSMHDGNLVSPSTTIINNFNNCISQIANNINQLLNELRVRHLSANDLNNRIFVIDTQLNLLNQYTRVAIKNYYNNMNMGMRNNMMNNMRNNNRKYSDKELEKKIKEIHELENLSLEQKIDQIVELIDKNGFNDYKTILTAVLPIIDSIQTTNDKQVKVKSQKNGEWTEENNNISDDDVRHNFKLRRKFENILLPAISKHIDEKIKVLNSKNFNKSMAAYIEDRKYVIALDYADVVINSIYYGKYATHKPLLKCVDDKIEKYKEDYLNSTDNQTFKNICVSTIGEFLEILSKETNDYQPNNLPNNGMNWAGIYEQRSKEIRNIFDIYSKRFRHIQSFNELKDKAEEAVNSFGEYVLNMSNSPKESVTEAISDTKISLDKFKNAQ